jgi:hypothetical protein
LCSVKILETCRPSFVGVDGAPEAEEPDKVPTPPDPRVFVLRDPGGSVSGKLGICGSGLL